MAEYVKKSDVINLISDMLEDEWGYEGLREDIAFIISKIPVADVEEVKHGKWIGKQLDNFRKYEVTCSNCGWVGIENYDSYNDPSDFNYCPNCGAKMDGEGRV